MNDKDKFVLFEFFRIKSSFNYTYIFNSREIIIQRFISNILSIEYNNAYLNLA
jgi:hypothetical protein